MNQKNVFIEGMPGSGKTTVFDLLSLEYPEYVFHKETRIFEARYIINLFVRQTNYLQAEISKFRSSNSKIHLFDRSYISTLAYSFCLEKLGLVSIGFYNEIRSVCETMIHCGLLLKPNTLFVMLINPLTSIQRRTNRTDLDSEDIMLNPDFLEAMFDFYSTEDFTFFCSGDIYRIDVSDMRVEKLVVMIKKVIKKR